MDTYDNSAVAVEGRISGSEVIADLLDRIAEKLATSDSLRSSDSYLGYSAHVQISIQLQDFDTTEVVAEAVIGTLHAQRPQEQVVVVVPPVTGEEIAERLGLSLAPSLERPVDGSEPEPPRRRSHHGAKSANDVYQPGDSK